MFKTQQKKREWWFLEIESNAREILRIIYHKTNKETFPLFSCTQGAVRAQKKYKKCRKKHSTTCPPYTLHSSRVSEQEIVKAALFVK